MNFKRPNFLLRNKIRQDLQGNRFKVYLTDEEKQIYRRKRWVWSTQATMQMVSRELKRRRGRVK